MSKELNDYHKQRSIDALKAVEEMQKHPVTLEEALAQVKRIKAQRNPTLNKKGLETPPQDSKPEQ